MEQENVAIRLKVFIQSLGITNSQFADKCGIPRPSLSQLLGGRNKKISDVLIGLIHQAYPELSVLWLLFGEGSMMTGNDGPNASSGFENENAMSEHICSESENDHGLFDTSENGQEGTQGTNLFAEDGFKPTVYSGSQKYVNVKALNKPINANNHYVNQQDSMDAKTLELMKQIDKMKKNPRKVSQITVYYDDSTFETFYPQR